MVNTRSMEVISYGKSKQVLDSVVRGTSCSRGWLRLVVQIIFGFIIVSSFIMILRMAIGTYYKDQLRPQHRCVVMGCRVICNDAPFLGHFEDDVVHAVGNVNPSCSRIILTLNQPVFKNYTLSGQWLSGIRINVSELEIVGGNLLHILPNSFMSQFGRNIRVLVLEEITVSDLAPDTFLGLSSLEELYLKNCELTNIRHSALQSIDNTLQFLKINTHNYWDPVNVTGSTHFEQLRIVDFSSNTFNDILGHNSFTGLTLCKVLFLNSCNIKSIGSGAFDSLKSIEIIHLQNNRLVSLPTDIFKKIIALNPRISLQENPWECSCDNYNFRLLSKLDLLIVDPVCYHPTALRGMTFSKLEKYCQNDSNDSILESTNEEVYVYDSKSNAIFNEYCESNTSTDTYGMRVSSPLPEYNCTSYKIHESKPEKNIARFSTDCCWLTPTFSIDINGFSMVTLVFSEPYYDYGLIWYKSTCPNYVYCMKHLPKSLHLYNTNSSFEYTFCRVYFSSTNIISDKCVVFDRIRESSIIFYKSVLLLVCIGIICLLSGALAVYGLIHKNPNLLKGNKRVVFVKHKTVDALILPPKISLRCNFTNDLTNAERKKNSVFVVTENRGNHLTDNFLRTNSVRTTDSNDPSYVSALQPTEEQLAKWRITRHFEVKCKFDSIDSSSSTHSQTICRDSLPYYSLDRSGERIYDTII